MNFLPQQCSLLAVVPLGPVHAVSAAVMLALAVALLFSVVRLMMGPSLPDRVVALDLIAVLSAAMIAVYSILIEQPMLLRAAIVLALVAFLGTVAFALYLEKRARP